jgi:hypothetical protein
MSNTIKSSNSTEKIKLKTLQSPNKISPKVSKSHDGSDSSKQLII